MTHYNKGDVVLVPFPFSDQTTTKKRPAVIVSSNKYNDTSRDIVIMAITSQARGNIRIGGGERCLSHKKTRMANLLKIANPDEALYREIMLALGYKNTPLPCRALRE